MPKPIRDLLGLSADSRVDFVAEPDGTVCLVRCDDAPPQSARVAALRGSAAVRVNAARCLR
ncbi:MAG: AbrB/MazE/SpoVT family DNA-binding domain-containing protein [Azonexus sp.]|jgi:bifunctional DNA-binding transcriptional regulator/antitoxin component of YhaV-PrlF toxin-antitoxin module|nr:AbrB/MazE/SpoVT family DNA-binding domain-containing protein [Azonexus sp.]